MPRSTSVVAIAGVEAAHGEKRLSGMARAMQRFAPPRRGQIGLDDSADRPPPAAGVPSRDDAALRQHEDVLGKTHHRLHHVLDHDDGDAARR